MELIVTDGGKGLLAALPFVYPGIPVQRCWAHKTRNVLNHIRKADQKTAKKDLAAVSNAEGIKQARTALKRFACTWKATYPKALASLRECEEELLAFFQIKDRNLWKKIRTTNLIEKRFRELGRRTRPWESSPIKPAWRESSMPSLPMKTSKTRPETPSS